MPTSTPYKGKSIDRFVALANSDNSTEYVLGQDFTLGSFNPSSAVQGKNTVVNFTSLVDGKDGGSFYFNRLNLSVLGLRNDLEPIELTNLPTSVHELLPVINESLGLDLESFEVEDLPITEPVARIRIQITNACPAWLPGSFYEAPAITDSAILLESGNPLETETGELFELESA